MYWKLLKTKLGGSDAEAPSFFSDEQGRGHAAWIESSVLHHSFFGGIEWANLLESSNTDLTLSDLNSNGIATDRNGFPHILGDQYCFFDGEEWQSSAAPWDFTESSCLVYANNLLYSFRTVDDSGLKLQWSKHTNGWSAASSEGIDGDNSSKIIARANGQWVHIFWSATSGTDCWIGHAVFNTDTETYSLAPTTIAPSESTGEISGLSFIPYGWMASTSSESNEGSLGLLCWTTRNGHASTAHACWARTMAWEVPPLTSSLISPARLGVLGNVDGIQGPFYSSPSGIFDTKKSLRLRCVSEQLTDFISDPNLANNIAIEPLVLPTFSTASRCLTGVAGFDRQFTLLYLRDGNIAAMTELLTLRFSTSSSTDSSQSSLSMSSSTIVQDTSSSRSNSSQSSQSSDSSPSSLSSNSSSSSSSSSSTFLSYTSSSSSVSPSTCSWCETTSDYEPVVYETACVAHFRGGNGGPAGDWEYGLGVSTNNIAVNANVVWPNNSFVSWSLSYSVPGGTLTLTVNGVSLNWTPGTAIPNDDKRWKLLLELYATSDRTHQIATENVALSIDATDYPLDDMLVTSGNSAAASIQPHRLGNQVWIVTGSVGLGWTGDYPNASRLQAILRLQRET